MKRYIFIILALSVFGVYAQNSYDAARFFQSEGNGTARFLGMGGAMSALGGDISVISTNPAGIGVYRGQDIALSISADNALSRSNYLGTKNSDSNTKYSFDNFGIVLANSIENEYVKFVNFAIAYKRNSGFNRDFKMSGDSFTKNADGSNNYFSQVYEMMELYNYSNFDVDNIKDEYYTNLNYNWLALLGYDGNLYSVDEKGAYAHYTPEKTFYYSEERGGIDEAGINLSTNISDRIYLGATLGFYAANYNRYSYYGEDDKLGEIYTLYNWSSTEGTGVDFKLGAIMRPFANSPFRLGVAVHTPTWYVMVNRSSAYLLNPMDGYRIDTQEIYGGDYVVNYRVTTPWKINASAAYTFGRSLAVNAEYEYTDYSTAGIKYYDGYSNFDINEELSSNTKSVHTVRVGAELRLSNNFSLRGGYNYVSAPYNKEAAKYIISNDDTATEYLNRFATHSASLGLGYYNKDFYADFAYRFSVQNSEFYPYYDSQIINPSAAVQDIRNHFVLTIGGRF